MDIQELIQKIHQDILDWAETQPAWKGEIKVTDPEMLKKMRAEADAGVTDGSIIKITPKDKRVVRTKSTGDRVYLIDETAKTKAWVTSPEILAKLGFELSDVEDVEDSEMLGYAMTASLYRVEE